MSEYQIMRWREIPSMVIARSGETTIKIMLAEIDADAYTSGWNRDPWVEAEGTPDVVGARIVEELERDLSEEKLSALLDALGEK